MFFSFINKFKNTHAQIATIFTLIIALLFLFTIVIVNIERHSKTQRMVSNAADTAALSAASTIGSFANYIYHQMGDCLSRWSYDGEIIKTALVTGISLIASAVSGNWWAVLLAAGLGGGSLYLASENKADALKEQEEEFKKMSLGGQASEQSLMLALINAVDDPNMVIDEKDIDRDGNVQEKISALSQFFYDRRKMLKIRRAFYVEVIGQLRQDVIDFDNQRTLFERKLNTFRQFLDDLMRYTELRVNFYNNPNELEILKNDMWGFRDNIVRTWFFNLSNNDINSNKDSWVSQLLSSNSVIGGEREEYPHSYYNRFWDTQEGRGPNNQHIEKGWFSRIEGWLNELYRIRLEVPEEEIITEDGRRVNLRVELEENITVLEGFEENIREMRDNIILFENNYANVIPGEYDNFTKRVDYIWNDSRGNHTVTVDLDSTPLPGAANMSFDDDFADLISNGAEMTNYRGTVTVSVTRCDTPSNANLENSNNVALVKFFRQFFDANRTCVSATSKARFSPRLRPFDIKEETIQRSGDILGIPGTESDYLAPDEHRRVIEERDGGGIQGISIDSTSSSMYH